MAPVSGVPLGPVFVAAMVWQIVVGNEGSDTPAAASTLSPAPQVLWPASELPPPLVVPALVEVPPEEVLPVPDPPPTPDEVCGAVEPVVPPLALDAPMLDEEEPPSAVLSEGLPEELPQEAATSARTATAIVV
jgi:hypothetical protein